MERVRLNSKRIRSVGYDVETSKMEVEFPNTKVPTFKGAIYLYHDVPPEIHAGLVHSNDAGQYFADNIVGHGAQKNRLYKYDLIAKAETEGLADPGLPNVRPPAKQGMQVVREGPITVITEDFLTGTKTVQTPAEVDAAAKAAVAEVKPKTSGLLGIGVRGKGRSESSYCEEASPMSTKQYIPCAAPATRQVYHKRDDLTLAMCGACADHNVRNRGGEYVDLVKPETQGQLLPPATALEELPQEHTALVAHAESVRTRVQALLKVNGVQVRLAVTTPEGFEEVGKLFVALSAEKKAAQILCDEDRKPHNEAYKAGLAREKEVMGKYEILGQLDRAIVDYKAEKLKEKRLAEQRAREVEQARLDAEAAEQAKLHREQTEREAKNLEAAGQHKIAEVIRATPAPVVAQTAKPIEYASEVPKIEGMRETGTWQVAIENLAAIPIFFKDRVRQAINDTVAACAGKPIDDTAMVRLTMQLATILGDFYSIDATKLNGFLKPKKEAGIDLVPGVKVWFQPRTSTTGR